MTPVIPGVAPLTTVEVVWSPGDVLVPAAGDFEVRCTVSPPATSGRRGVHLAVRYTGAAEAVAAVRFSAAVPGRTAGPW